jgi:hypothetical protein
MRAIEKDFNNAVEDLQNYMSDSTDGPAGSFPVVGKRSGKLHRSLQKIKLSPHSFKLGFYVNYATEALLKQRQKYRGWIGPNGKYRQFWSSKFKK